MEFSVLTLNAGLLKALRGLAEPVPHVDARFGALARALRGSRADVILLQEVYRHAHREALCRALGDTHPFNSLYAGNAGWNRLGSGLLALSRAPMEASFASSRHMTLDERLADRGGLLVARVSMDGRAVGILNVHATAGGLLWHPESPRVERLRRRQFEEFLSQALRYDCAILAGDLNCGPEASPSNFRWLIESGWLDCYAEANTGLSDPTWDPANVLNANGPHRSSPPQRVDHVLLRRHERDAGRIAIRSAAICFRDPQVQLPHDIRVTISDHYGVRVELEL